MEEDFGIKLPVQRIYRLMDVLHKRIGRIQQTAGQAALGIFNNSVDVMLYDVTTLYFESRQADELRRFGFSKDCKMNEVQVVPALAATKEGLPLAYKLFHGSTFEGSTPLGVTLEEFSRLFKIKRVICIAERGMFSEANLAWLEAKGWEFIVAVKLKNLSQTWKETILAYAANQSQEQAWIKDWTYDDKRKLVVTFSLDRRQKDYYGRRTKERIEAHIAICFIAFSLAKHAAYRVSLQHAPHSFEFIRNELLAVQAGILKDLSTKKLYRIPSSFSPDAGAIYRCFGLQRSLTPSPI